MTSYKCVEFQVRLSDAETQATTQIGADMDCVANQLEREINGITSNDQMRFKKKLSIRLIMLEAWWKAIGSQELRNTIEQLLIHFG